MTIKAKELQKCYYKNGIKATAVHFKVTPKTIYKYLKLYEIETVQQKKDREWYDKVDELNKKWAKQKYRNWWGCGD